MALVNPVCPEWVYADKTNIRFPGSAAQAAAALTTAQNRMNDQLANPLKFSGTSDITVTINAGDIIPSN